MGTGISQQSAISTINSKTNITKSNPGTKLYFIATVSLHTHHLQLDKRQYLPWSLDRGVPSPDLLGRTLAQNKESNL